MNQILFGVIGLLMLGIVGTGGVALYSHPDAPAIVAEHITATMQDTVTSIKKLVPGSGTPTVSNTVQRASDDGDGDREGEDDDDSRAQTSVAQPKTTASPTPPSTPSTPSAPGTFTMAQVGQHNSAASCYSAINGSVYDLTSFINQHPGGSAAIKSLCGVDGTSAYAAQHGGQSRPANELASLKIGTVAK